MPIALLIGAVVAVHDLSRLRLLWPTRDTRKDAVHVHRVGDEQALEAELLAQQAGHDRRIERRGDRCGVERGNETVKRHHALDAGCDRRAERHELHAVEARADSREPS